MTGTPTPASSDARDLLRESRDLTRRVRRAQRGAWFPLLAFALLTLGAVPVIRYGPRDTACTQVPGPAGTPGRVCTIFSLWVLCYWLAAFLVAYVVIAAFYVRRSRQRGVGTRVRPYVVAGVVLAVALTGVSVLAAYHPAAFFGLAGQPLQTGLLFRAVSPDAAIGLALLVLARTERSGALLAFAVGFLLLTLAPTWSFFATLSPWYFLPRLLLTAAWLGLGSLGFGLAQRSAARTAGRPAQGPAS